MKTYRITITTEYVIEANTEDEADSYYGSIEELSEED